MDKPNNPSTANSTPKPHKHCKRKIKDISNIPSKKVYFNSPYQLQNWSFPDSIIYYITQKPSSSKGYQKMIQSCKYFFAKNPIIVLDDFSYYFNWAAKFDIEVVFPFKKDGKIWLIDIFIVGPQQQFHPNITSSIVSRIYQCDVKHLILTDQIISYEQFLFLTSNVIRIKFTYVIVQYQDGTILPIEKLVELLTKAKDINFDTRARLSAAALSGSYDATLTITTKSMKELIKIEHFSKICVFGLYNITETFDLETFYNYMKTNKHTKFTLIFNQVISEAYKNHLETIVDEIIAAETPDFRRPTITFPELAAEKRIKMFRTY